MADPEHPAGKARQAVAEGHVEMFQNRGAEGVGVMAFRHHHRRQRTRKVSRFLAQHLKPPGLDGAAGGLGMPVMPGKYIVEAFLVKHVDGLGKAVEKIRRRCIGEGAAGIGGKLFVPVPVGPAKAVGLRLGNGAFGDGVEGQARRQHKAFLRS